MSRRMQPSDIGSRLGFDLPAATDTVMRIGHATIALADKWLIAAYEPA